VRYECNWVTIFVRGTRLMSPPRHAPTPDIMQLQPGPIRAPLSSDGVERSAALRQAPSLRVEAPRAAACWALAREGREVLGKAAVFRLPLRDGECRVDAVELLDFCGLYKREPKWFVRGRSG
jgi:hypothetical protein